MPVWKMFSPLFCFVRKASGDTPHFEVLPECSQVGALKYAARLLREHQDCDIADLWSDERLMLSLSRADLPAIEASPLVA
jgi:hypothetical protein